MSLTEKQKRHLKGVAHSLKPVVMLGQSGLTDGVLAELGIALDHHELVKVKVSAGDRELRDQLIERLATSTQALLIQRIGNIAVLYRRNPKKKNPIEIPAI